MAGSQAGLVAITKLVEHICRIITKYRAQMNAVIAAAVAAGSITSAQAAELEAWLDALTGVCAIIKLVTKY